MQLKQRVFIGIDPDTNKSGFAVVNKALAKVVQYEALPFFKLLSKIQTVHSAYKDDMVVIVEAGWKNDITNFHKASGKQGQRIALNVGRNQQVGMLVVEYCKENGIEVIEASPLVKGWKGKDRKITHEELAYFTGITGKSNQETRDSVLICWYYAGLPIKIKPICNGKY